MSVPEKAPQPEIQADTTKAEFTIADFEAETGVAVPKFGPEDFLRETGVAVPSFEPDATSVDQLHETEPTVPDSSATQAVDSQQTVTATNPNAAPAKPEKLGSKELTFTISTFDNPTTSDKKSLFGQDKGYANEATGFAVAADGMGNPAGTTVAETVVQSIQQASIRSDIKTILDGAPDDLAKATVKSILQAASFKVSSMQAIGTIAGRDQGERNDPGCTLAGMIPFTDFHGKSKAAVFAVGDGAVLRTRNGKTERITVEESLAAQNFRSSGTYNEKVQNVITNFFGGDPSDKVGIYDHTVVIIDVLPGDKYLVTTDGLEELYTDAQNYPNIPSDFNNLMNKSAADIMDYLNDRAAKKASNGGFTKTDDRLAYVVEVGVAEGKTAAPSSSTQRKVGSVATATTVTPSAPQPSAKTSRWRRRAQAAR